MTILNLDDDLRASLYSTSGEPVVLQNISVTGELRGALLDAQVRQTFINPTKKHLEVVYSFPLPWGAELLGVEVQLNDATLYGTVVEKAHALQGYEHSLAQGDAAIMLERGHDGHYVTWNWRRPASPRRVMHSVSYTRRQRLPPRLVSSSRWHKTADSIVTLSWSWINCPSNRSQA